MEGPYTTSMFIMDAKVVVAKAARKMEIILETRCPKY